MKRKICIITGSRAEYGLLETLIKLIQKDKDLSLQLVVTGTHLSPEFGYTIKEIKKDRCPISRKLEILLSSDTAQSITKSTGLAMISFADSLYELKPDLLILLGDRFEMLAAASAAHLANIPIAHISGGEITEGSFDDAIRHSITKMSWWHFVATKDYQRRVMQLGEDKSRIFITGGMGIDMIKNTKLFSKVDLQKSLKCKFSKKNLLISFHPETLGTKSSQNHLMEILSSLELLKETSLFFTAPNADSQGRTISKMIEDYVKGNHNSYYFKSLGKERYLSMLKYVDGIVGNSSSGLTEAPNFKVATINLGNRQKGRSKAASIIDCEIKREEISKAIEKIYLASYKNKLKKVVNTYGKGGASKKIFKIIKFKKIPKNLQKTFIDLK